MGWVWGGGMEQTKNEYRILAGGAVAFLRDREGNWRITLRLILVREDGRWIELAKDRV